MNQVLSVVVIEVGDEFLNEVMQVTENDEGLQVGELRVIDEEMDDVVEKEVEGELYRFCSDECAEKFEEKREKESI